MNELKFLQGLKENLPLTKDANTVYHTTDTGDLYIGNTHYIKAPTTNGTNGQVLATDGNDACSWIDVNSSGSRYPLPTNQQDAPLYTTLTDLKITPTAIFSSSIDGDTSKTYRRIPTIMVTNNSTYIAGCEARTSSSDSSQIDILVARKATDSTSWSYYTAFTYSSTEAYKYMNPSFVVDRQGLINGNVNRVYLFALKFKITTANSGDWTQISASEVANGYLDTVYKYSDDDGVTWSSEQSVGATFDTTVWRYTNCGYSNSIQMSDGTLVVPCMGVDVDGNQHSGLLYKKTDGNWVYSSPSPVNGENECTVYENNGTIYINTRNTVNSRCIYSYDFDNDAFTLVDDSFVPHEYCGACCEEMTIDNVHMYTLAFIDTDSTTRQNPTIWVSADGVIFDKAIRIYEGETNGYCCCSSYNNYVGFVYSRDGVIYFVDLSSSSAKNILTNCASFLSLADQYKVEITKEHRFTALGYLFGTVSAATPTPTGETVDLTAIASTGASGYGMVVSGNSTTPTGSIAAWGDWTYLYVDVTAYRGKTLTVSINNSSPKMGLAFSASEYAESGNTFIDGSTIAGADAFTVTEHTITIPDTAVTMYLDYRYTGTYANTPVATVQL